MGGICGVGGSHCGGSDHLGRGGRVWRRHVHDWHNGQWGASVSVESPGSAGTQFGAGHRYPRRRHSSPWAACLLRPDAVAGGEAVSPGRPARGGHAAVRDLGRRTSRSRRIVTKLPAAGRCTLRDDAEGRRTARSCRGLRRRTYRPRKRAIGPHPNGCGKKGQLGGAANYQNGSRK